VTSESCRAQPLSPNHGQWEAAFNHESGTNVGSSHKGWTETPPSGGWSWQHHGQVSPALPSFNALHAALIPVGPYRGCILAWDYHESQAAVPYQRYSIIDPNGGIQLSGQPGVYYTFLNRWIAMPNFPDEGDLFCPGLAWTRDGRLFVAGGTRAWPPGFNGFPDVPLAAAPPWLGGRMVWLFDPTRLDPLNGAQGLYGEWAEVSFSGSTLPARMQRYRWYPTVTVDHNDKMVITGGIDAGSYVMVNNYEAMGVVPRQPNLNPWAQGTYDVHSPGTSPSDRVFLGPSGPDILYFDLYPRMHMLTDGSLLCSGFFSGWARKEHPLVLGPDTGWNVGPGGSVASRRYYGSSFLLPNPAPGAWDVVMRTGGFDPGPPPVVTPTVEYFSSTSSPPQWKQFWQSMHYGRTCHNTVPLPDGKVFVVGGGRTGAVDCGTILAEALLTPELLTPSGWVLLSQAPHASPRIYHSTALLLPDARVFVAGGECRFKDYEIYKPPYLTGGRPRPTGIHVSADVLQYNSLYNVSFLPFPDDDVMVTVSKVVLIRPGAVTHHTDMDTRYIELVSQAGAGQSRDFLTPPSSSHAPRGYYMLFLVTNEGVPSVASWVHLGG